VFQLLAVFQSVVPVLSQSAAWSAVAETPTWMTRADDAAKIGRDFNFMGLMAGSRYGFPEGFVRRLAVETTLRVDPPSQWGTRRPHPRTARNFQPAGKCLPRDEHPQIFWRFHGRKLALMDEGRTLSNAVIPRQPSTLWAYRRNFGFRPPPFIGGCRGIMAVFESGRHPSP